MVNEAEATTTNPHKLGDKNGKNKFPAHHHHVTHMEEKYATPEPPGLGDGGTHIAPFEPFTPHAGIGSSPRASTSRDRADYMTPAGKLVPQTKSTASSPHKSRDASNKMAPGGYTEPQTEPPVPEFQESGDGGGNPRSSSEVGKESQDEKTTPQRAEHSLQSPTAQVCHGLALIRVRGKVC